MLDDADWARLAAQLRRGDCTPFLGSGACHPTLPTGHALSEQWAEREDYPFQDRTNLPRVMQYAAARAKDAVEVKHRLTHELQARSAPPHEPLEPHCFLARHDLPVYLTTNYDDYIVRALRAEGKQPQVAICPWYMGAPRDTDPLFRVDPARQPSSEEPLVYYLHGSFAKPQSLVLTEDDYIEFLVNLARGNVESDRGLIPLPIVEALNRPLLFIGYSLEDWTFRVVYRGVLRDVAEVQRRRHVSVQLPPSPADESRAAAAQNARDHLGEALNAWNVSVYWGTGREFCAELGQRLEAG